MTWPHPQRSHDAPRTDSSQPFGPSVPACVQDDSEDDDDDDPDDESDTDMDDEEAAYEMHHARGAHGDRAHLEDDEADVGIYDVDEDDEDEDEDHSEDDEEDPIEASGL